MTEMPFAGDRLIQAAAPTIRQRVGRHLAERVLRRKPEADRRLKGTLRTLDDMIPSSLDDFHPTTGKRYERNKESNAKDVQEAITSTFNSLFADQRDGLVGATDDLFAELIIKSERDTVSLARIDHLLAGYPHNIIAELGYQASGENLLAVLSTSQRLLQMCDDDAEEGNWVNYIKGKVAELIGSHIPQLVAHEGKDSLTELEAVATEHGIDEIKSYIDFKLRYKDGTPTLPWSAEAIVNSPAPVSPFTQESATEAWRKEAWMGAQQRSPEWGDLGHMAAITDQWSKEYGFTVSRAEDGTMTLGFIRGLAGSVKNRHNLDPKDRQVFFHSHPSKGTGDGLYAPLISVGDIDGTLLMDYGGAYLNIVCKSGITLQIDSRPAAKGDPPGWVVESGDLKGTTISPNGTASAETSNVLKALHVAKAPFMYSINKDGDVGLRKMTFVHVPWQHLDTTGASVQNVCFGDGLEKILPPEFREPEDAPSNLYSAIQKAKVYPRVKE